DPRLGWRRLDLAHARGEPACADAHSRSRRDTAAASAGRHRPEDRLSKLRSAGNFGASGLKQPRAGGAHGRVSRPRCGRTFYWRELELAEFNDRRDKLSVRPPDAIRDLQ